MQYRNLCYLSSLILFLLFSCKNKLSYSYELHSLGVWETPLDTLTSNLSYQQRVVRFGDKEFLGMYSVNLHAITLWDLKTKEKKYQIKFNRDGPNGVYRLNGFYFKSLDSIYVMPTYYKFIALMNSKGQLLNKYIFSENVKNKAELDKIDFIGDFNIPMQIVQNKVLLGTTPYENSISPKFGNMPLGFTYDLKTRACNTNFMGFSDEYKKKTLGYFHSQYYSDLDLTNKNCIVSFSADEKIYLRNIEGNLVDEYVANSDFFNLDLPIINKSGQAIFENYFLVNPSFGKILADPFRKVYYRFAFQKYDNSEKVLTGMMESYKPCSVIILNEKFDKIGETILPLNKHFITNAFVGKNGLYISNAHPKNPDNDENKLSFTCYALEKK